MPTPQPWSINELDHSDDRLLIAPKFWWEERKIGANGVPIPTDDGWLMLYHGVGPKGVYRFGLLLLDREDPSKVLARSPEPVMEPTEPYEHEGGSYPHCVFSCANPLIGDEVFVYYGGTDRCCCVATIPLKGLLDHALSCQE